MNGGGGEVEFRLRLRSLSIPSLASSSSSWKEDSPSSYTSLRDFINEDGAIIDSPGVSADTDVITNALVKKAAFAYLLPRPSYAVPPRRRFSLCRVVENCFGFFFGCFIGSEFGTDPTP